MAKQKTSDTENNGRNWLETPITEDILFRGKDAHGRAGWFLRLTVTGLYPRRIGPYATRTKALEVLAWFVADIELGQFLDLENEVKETQAYIVEGVPTLKGVQP